MLIFSDILIGLDKITSLNFADNYIKVLYIKFIHFHCF